MPLDPNIILQAGNFKTPDYATTLAQVANIKASGQEAKLRDLQISGVQRDNDTRVLLSKAFDPATGEVDPVKARAAYMASGDIEGATKFDTNQLAKAAGEIEYKTKLHGFISNALAGVRDQASLDAARAELGKNPATAQGAAQLPQVYDDAGAAAIQALIQKGQTQGEQLQAAKFALEQKNADYAQLDAGSDAIQSAMDKSVTIPKYRMAIQQKADTAAAEANAKLPAELAVAKAKADAATGTTMPADNPIVQSWVKNVLGGNATMQQVPAPLRNSVSMAITDAPKEAYSPLASSRFTMAANRIVGNFIKLPQYELTANGLPYLQRIDAAMKTPGSVSDQDLLDSLTKLNTAGNAITDAQVKIITDGKSFADSMATFGNKFKNGGVLSDNQRQQIQEIAKNIYANYKKGYQPVYDQATKQLEASGIPKAFWTIPDLNNLSGQSGATDTAQPAAPSESKTIGGVTYHKVNGQWMQ